MIPPFLNAPSADTGCVPVPRRAPAPGARAGSRPRLRRLCLLAGGHAFTLVELLGVMAVMATLVGIALGLARGVMDRTAIARARAELAVLAQAVDAWRDHYGCFPSVRDAAQFYESLTGRRGPQGGVLDPSGRAFIEVARFSLRFPDPAAPGNDLLDPWGQPYNYVPFVRTLPGCTTAGFIVFSNGPDGRAKPDDPPATGVAAGVPDFAAPDNADNLYSNR